MAGAVNMSIVAGLCLILNVSSVNGNAALSLFGSTVNVGIIQMCIRDSMRTVAAAPMRAVTVILRMLILLAAVIEDPSLFC